METRIVLQAPEGIDYGLTESHMPLCPLCKQGIYVSEPHAMLLIGNAVGLVHTACVAQVQLGLKRAQREKRKHTRSQVQGGDTNA